jgi:hypothetical protein
MLFTQISKVFAIHSRLFGSGRYIAIVPPKHLSSKLNLKTIINRFADQPE